MQAYQPLALAPPHASTTAGSPPPHVCSIYAALLSDFLMEKKCEEWKRRAHDPDRPSSSSFTSTPFIHLLRPSTPHDRRPLLQEDQDLFQGFATRPTRSRSTRPIVSYTRPFYQAVPPAPPPVSIPSHPFGSPYSHQSWRGLVFWHGGLTRGCNIEKMRRDEAGEDKDGSLFNLPHESLSSFAISSSSHRRSLARHHLPTARSWPTTVTGICPSASPDMPPMHMRPLLSPTPPNPVNRDGAQDVANGKRRWMDHRMRASEIWADEEERPCSCTDKGCHATAMRCAAFSSQNRGQERRQDGEGRETDGHGHGVRALGQETSECGYGDRNSRRDERLLDDVRRPP